MKKYILIIVTLFIVGCNANKQIQLTQMNDNKIELLFSDYGNGISQVAFFIKKKVKLKNPYFGTAKMKIYYFLDGKQISDTYAYPMEYWKDGHLYRVGSGKGENLHEIELSPLREKEIIYEIFSSIEPFEFTGKYKSLEQYIPLAKHPIYKNEWTGKKEEDKGAFIYEESFSEFKRKNPELAESLIKGDTIELEVLSPIEAKYRYDAQW